jgi:hypothetical protein
MEMRTTIRDFGTKGREAAVLGFKKLGFPTITKNNKLSVPSTNEPKDSLLDCPLVPANH